MTATIQTDLSATFDTIDATALTDKLNYYGVTGQELKIFTSFLTDRRQYVQIDTFTSRTDDSLPCSVVQGSKLSLTLYTLYTNEITSLHKIMGTDDYEQITGLKTDQDFDIDHIIINYVDDSTNIISSDNSDQLQRYIDQYYILLTNYYDINYLEINSVMSKFTYHFGSLTHTHMRRKTRDEVHFCKVYLTIIFDY